MSFPNTRSPLKKDCDKRKQKWVLPLRKTPSGMKKLCLEGEAREQFIKLFPKYPNRTIMEWFGISQATVHQFRDELGLQKDMKTIRKKMGRQVARALEKKGLYASRRGKPMPEACIEALRKRRKEYEPWIVLKERNPRKYKKSLKKRSASWRATYEMEIKRLRWGLPQKTKFNVTLCPLSHKAISQKYSMIRRNNYFSVPEHPSWVCYDEQTKRSARSEATAAKNGLRIVQGD